MIRVIGQDTHLRWWLKRIVELPANLRASEVGQLAATMMANGEDTTLVAAFNRLASRRSAKRYIRPSGSYTDQIPRIRPGEMTGLAAVSISRDGEASTLRGIAWLLPVDRCVNNRSIADTAGDSAGQAPVRCAFVDALSVRQNGRVC